MSLSSSWYQQVRTRLDSSGIFVRIEVIGAKVRAFIREELYVDIYYDPTTSSYSYALIDQTLPNPGDKRVFGWDDYPHDSVPEVKRMKSYPHHFQRRSQGQSTVASRESAVKALDLRLWTMDFGRFP